MQPQSDPPRGETLRVDVKAVRELLGELVAALPERCDVCAAPRLAHAHADLGPGNVPLGGHPFKPHPYLTDLHQRGVSLLQQTEPVGSLPYRVWWVPTCVGIDAPVPTVHTRPVLVARCGNFVEDPATGSGDLCTGEIRYRWGETQSGPCDVCAARCGVAVASWLRVDVEPIRPGE